MNRLNNNKGVALVTALMLTLISLTIVMALMYMITQGTTVSASNKKEGYQLYKSFTYNRGRCR